MECNCGKRRDSSVSLLTKGGVRNQRTRSYASAMQGGCRCCRAFVWGPASQPCHSSDRPTDGGQLCICTTLSRDGRVAAVTRTIAGSTNVWLLDTERGVPRRLTFDVNDNDVNRFHPTALASRTRRTGHVTGQSSTNGMRMAREGEIQLLEESVRRMAFTRRTGPPTGVTSSMRSQRRRVWICGLLPLSGERAPFDIARTSFAELGARVSPDSRWVAYESNETGRLEIYVQPFPGPGPKVQVSAGGRQDGALAARTEASCSTSLPIRRLMAVSVARSASNILNWNPPSS